MADKLHWKQHANAQALLNSVYDEIKDASPSMGDAEIAERVQFFQYNLESKKYEIIYFKPE